MSDKKLKHEEDKIVGSLLSMISTKHQEVKLKKKKWKKQMYSRKSKKKSKLITLRNPYQREV